jgi:hypothetical protein
MISDGGYQQKAGAVAFGGPLKTAPANPQLGSIGFADRSAEDAMAASIVHLLARLADVEAERDFYKAAASKLMRNGGHKK